MRTRRCCLSFPEARPVSAFSQPRLSKLTLSPSRSMRHASEVTLIGNARARSRSRCQGSPDLRAMPWSARSPRAVSPCAPVIASGAWRRRTLRCECRACALAEPQTAASNNSVSSGLSLGALAALQASFTARGRSFQENAEYALKGRSPMRFLMVTAMPGPAPAADRPIFSPGKSRPARQPAALA